MGGGSNSSPPSDVAPGGGTYPVDMWGNAYNPAWGGSGMGTAFSKGMQQFGSSVAASAPAISPFNPGGGVTPQNLPGYAPIPINPTQSEVDPFDKLMQELYARMKARSGREDAGFDLGYAQTDQGIRF